MVATCPIPEQEKMVSIGFDTPFAHQLNTNHVPTSEEQRTLQDLIRGSEEQIKVLDEEISRLQTRRQVLQQFVDLHRALLSPSRRVVADIWRMIFFESLPENDLGVCFRTTEEAPLLFTTICHSWREIALSTPTLWNSIHIYLPVPRRQEEVDDYYTSLLRGRKDGLKLWLDRSGALPITLSLATDSSYAGSEDLYFPPHWGPYPRPSDPYPPLTPNLRTQFTELLAQYSHRWKMVAFGKGVEALDLTPYERLTSNDLSSLESFHATGRLLDYEPNPEFGTTSRRNTPLANILTQARSLRRLRLTGETISEATLSLPLPWSNLTELYMPFTASETPRRIMQMLATECHSLITLSSDLHSPYEVTEAASAAPVPWPSLRSLHMKFRRDCFQFHDHGGAVHGHGTQAIPTSAFNTALMDTFGSVTLPDLARLSVGFADPNRSPYSNDDDVGPATFAIDKLPFEDLLQHCQFLTQLELSSPHIFCAETILRVLRPLEMLVSLSLGYKNVRSYRDDSWAYPMGHDEAAMSRGWLEQILKELLPPPSNPEHGSREGLSPVCPKLEELSVKRCSPKEIDLLVDFAMKKPGLRVLRVDFGGVFTPVMGSYMDMGKVKVLKEVRGGVTMEWKWDERYSDTRPQFRARDYPTCGMPGGSTQACPQTEEQVTAFPEFVSSRRM
ncbi:hypothetical protein PQX77_016343 [Marasmius sp. AFHP31]|nr:hypothetical protein PQX77_016343 [Marasmius sp. AFHP31]